MRILLIKRIGKACVSLEDGLSLKDDLILRLKNKERVDIDFEGVEKVYTPFLNGAFGGLFKIFDKEYINNHISFCMISSEHFKKITEFIDYMDRRETDREFREILNEYFGDDSLSEL